MMAVESGLFTTEQAYIAVSRQKKNKKIKNASLVLKSSTQKKFSSFLYFIWGCYNKY